MSKCKFCKRKTVKIEVINYLNKNNKGKFYNCYNCEVYINNDINEKMYTSSQKNLNSYFKKNVLYYLKAFFLYLNYFKIKNYFPKKQNNILDFGS